MRFNTPGALAGDSVDFPNSPAKLLWNQPEESPNHVNRIPHSPLLGYGGKLRIPKETAMGSLSIESFEQFLDSLKKAGIAISKEAELRERLAEVQLWRFAFQTLAANGKAIGISFEDRTQGRNQAEIERAFNEFHFSEKTKAIFSASLQH
jgi:hypothetical protein